MNKGVKIVVWSLVTAFGLLGIYAGLGIRKLMSVGYKIIKFQIKRFNLDSISIDLTLKICNPSVLAVDITGYNIDVYLNNKPVSNIKSSTPATLIANGNSLITIPLTVLYKTFGVVQSKEIINAFSTMQYSKIFINLQGTLDATILKIPAHVPIKYQITLQEIQKIMDDPTPSTSAPCN